MSVPGDPDKENDLAGRASSVSNATNALSITPSLPNEGSDSNLHFRTPAQVAEQKAQREQQKAEEKAEAEANSAAEAERRKQVAAKQHNDNLWHFIKNDPGFIPALGVPGTTTSFKRSKSMGDRLAEFLGVEVNTIRVQEGFLTGEGSSTLGKLASFLFTGFGGVLNETKAEITRDKDGNIVITAEVSTERGLLKEKNTIVAVVCARAIAQKELNLVLISKAEAVHGTKFYEFDPDNPDKQTKILEEIKANLPPEVLKEIYSFEVDHVNDVNELGEILQEMQNKQPELFAELSDKTYNTYKDPKSYENSPWKEAIQKQMELEKNRRAKKDKPKPEAEADSDNAIKPQANASTSNTDEVSTVQPRLPRPGG